MNESLELVRRQCPNLERCLTRTMINCMDRDFDGAQGNINREFLKKEPCDFYRNERREGRGLPIRWANGTSSGFCIKKPKLKDMYKYERKAKAN